MSKNYLDVEDLDVYNKLCYLHIRVSELTVMWPKQEMYEPASHVIRSSNSAPAQLAEKNDDRHVRNKIEGVNRCRVEEESMTYGVNRQSFPEGYPVVEE